MSIVLPKREQFNLLHLFQIMSFLLDVAHISRRGSSLRTTIPKKVQDKLGIREEDIIGFYEEDGRIYLKKMQ